MENSIDSTITVLDTDTTLVKFNVSYNYNNGVNDDAKVLTGLTFKGQVATADALVTFGVNPTTSEYANASIASYNPNAALNNLALTMADAEVKFDLPQVAVYTGEMNKKLSGSAEMTFQYSGDYKSFASANVLKQGNVTINPDFISGTSVSDYQIDGEVIIYKEGNKKKISKTANVRRASENYVMTLKNLAADVSDELTQPVWCGSWTGDIYVNNTDVADLMNTTSTCNSYVSTGDFIFNINGTPIAPANVEKLMEGLSAYFDQADLVAQP